MMNFVVNLKVPCFCLFVQGRNTAPELPNFLRSAAYMDYELEGNTVKGFIIRKVVGESEYDLTLMGDEYQSGKAVGARIRYTKTISHYVTACGTTLQHVRLRHNICRHCVTTCRTASKFLSVQGIF